MNKMSQNAIPLKPPMMYNHSMGRGSTMTIQSFFNSLFKKKYRYNIRQLIEFEKDPDIIDQRCRTMTILLVGFILYSIMATIPTLITSYGHSTITNVFVQIFLLINLIALRITKHHSCITIYGTYGLCCILFLSFITESDWTIGMDAYWLFVLILPFITNYLAGVFYGTISAFAGLFLSVILFYTRLINYLQPYGRNMEEWFPIIYCVAMFAAFTIEYELTAYQMEKKEADKKLAYFQKERTKRLREQLSIYESNENIIRKYRHDLRHYNRVMAGFLEDKEYDKAISYLGELDSSLEKVTAVSFCNNKVVNELLTIYASRCQKMGFKLRAKAVVPEHLPMEETDLTSLVANALENAVEAQEKLPEEKRHIKFEMEYDGRKLKLYTQNPTSVQNTFNNGLPISTREIQSGIGSKQIRDIAEKYGGAASFKQEDDSFILKAIMTCL
jgi:hypothetical protein